MIGSCFLCGRNNFMSRIPPLPSHHPQRPQTRKRLVRWKWTLQVGWLWNVRIGRHLSRLRKSTVKENSRHCGLHGSGNYQEAIARFQSRHVGVGSPHLRNGCRNFCFQWRRKGISFRKNHQSRHFGVKLPPKHSRRTRHLHSRGAPQSRSQPKAVAPRNQKPQILWRDKLGQHLFYGSPLSAWKIFFRVILRFIWSFTNWRRISKFLPKSRNIIKWKPRKRKSRGRRNSILVS